METELQFDQVQSPAGASACSGCQSALAGAYYQANGKVLCERCADGIRKFFQGKEGGFGRFLKATAFGLTAGLLGGAAYTAVLVLTHINAALVTIFIGWLVGKNVRKGSSGRGGIGYQILAVAITYWIIGLSLVLSAVFSPEAKHHSIPVVILTCIIGGFAAPVMAATESIFGAVITFFGLMQAWKLNTPVEVSITGPHTLRTSASVDPIDPTIAQTHSAPPPLPGNRENPSPECLSPALPS